MTTETIDELVENFEFLDDWEDRYRYIIDLGKELSGLPEDKKTDEHKVKGCTSQVWIISHPRQPKGADTVLDFEADSDAHIVRGLIAICMVLFSGKPAKEITKTDADAVFTKLGLHSHLTPSRRNGLVSMVDRIKRDAAAFCS